MPQVMRSYPIRAYYPKRVAFEQRVWYNFDLKDRMPMPNTVNMILDVNLPIEVQLGQTKMTIRELVNLKKGNIVKLNRMSGEPVDVFICKKLLAKGEITVVNDKLSIRVGQLYGEREKFKHL